MKSADKNSLYHFKTILLLIMPLLIVLFAVKLMSGSNFLFGPSLEVNSVLTQRMQILLLSINSLIVVVASIFFVVLTYFYLPDKFKKFFTTLICFLLIYWTTQVHIAVMVFVSCVLLFFSVDKLSLKMSVWASIVILIILALLFRIYPSHTSHEWKFYAQMLAGVFATIYYRIKNREGILFLDCLTMWCGIQGGMIVMLYGYHEFKSSFLNIDYTELVKKSFVRIYLGLSKLIFVGFVQYLYMGSWSRLFQTLRGMISFSHPMSGFELLYWAVILFLSFLLIHTGIVQITQGIMGLLGYNLRDAVNSPWFSKSLLDFWGRTSGSNKTFMMNHIFLPSYVKFRNLYLSNILVWSIWTILFAISVGLLSNGIGSMLAPWYEIFFNTLIKFVILYAHVLYFEMKLSMYISKNPKSAVAKFAPCMVFIIYLLTMFIGNEVFPSPFLLNFY